MAEDFNALYLLYGEHVVAVVVLVADRAHESMLGYYLYAVVVSDLYVSCDTMGYAPLLNLVDVFSA